MALKEEDIKRVVDDILDVRNSMEKWTKTVSELCLTDHQIRMIIKKISDDLHRGNDRLDNLEQRVDHILSLLRLMARQTAETFPNKPVAPEEPKKP